VGRATAAIEKSGGRFEYERRAVSFRGADIGDEQLASLSQSLEQLPDLGMLDLTGTRVSDAGLAHIQSLSQLKVLDLSGTKVSDAGLERLRGLGLSMLWLRQTEVTDEGVSKLKAESPQLSVKNPRLPAFDLALGVVFNLDGFDEGRGEGYLHGFKVRSEKRVESDGLHSRVRRILTDPKTYGIVGSECWEPGLAFRFGEADQTVDVLICLACDWAEFWENGHPQMWPLSPTGVAALRTVYNELFPQPQPPSE
jgi:hypothetical protein